MIVLKNCLLAVCLFFTTQFSFGQSTRVPNDALPTVFMMGEYEQQTYRMGKSCQTILLEVCQDSMDLAYEKWLTMLSDMETMAEKINFDLKGIKLWLNVYWNPDGTLRHLVFHPKPNCRNMDFKELSAFLTTFANRYQFDLKSEACFSHYGSVSFPTYAEFYLRSERK